MADELSGLISRIRYAIGFLKGFFSALVTDGIKEAERILEERWPEPPNIVMQPAAGGLHIIVTAPASIAEETGEQLGTVARHAHAVRRVTPSQQREIAMASSKQARVSGRQKLGDRLVTLINDPRASKSGVCPVCEALEGMTFTLTEFQQLVPLHPHCLLPGNVVEGNVIAALKSSYSGPALQLKTGQGRTLRVTPNHPVLTSHGFMPAEQLREGEELVCDGVDVGLTAGHNNSNANGPALIEQVFETLRAGGFTPCNPAADDLHGDARLVDGQIDIAFADRRLLRHVEAKCAKCGSQFSLPVADMLQLLEPAFGMGELSGQSLFGATPGGPSSGELPLNLGSIILDGSPPRARAFGASANWDAARHHPIQQDEPGNAELALDLIWRNTGKILTDRLIEVTNRNINTHVYDLQTTTGIIMSSGIAVSNCKCKWVPLLGGQGRAGQRPAVDMDDAGDVIIESISRRTPAMWDKFLREWKS